MRHNSVTSEERRRIHKWKQEGFSLRKMAGLLPRASGTISCKLKRNTGRRGYRPKQAQALADGRAPQPGPQCFMEAVRTNAGEKLGGDGRAHVCKETIYQHIYADDRNGSIRWTQEQMAVYITP